MTISKDEKYIILQYLNSNNITKYETLQKSILFNNLVEKMFYLVYTNQLELPPSKFVNLVNAGYYVNGISHTTIKESISKYMQDYIATNYKYISQKLHWLIIKDLANTIDINTLSNIINTTHNINYINDLSVKNASFIIRQYKKSVTNNKLFVDHLCSVLYANKAKRNIIKLILIELLRFKSTDFDNSNKLLLEKLNILKSDSKQFVYKYFKQNFIMNLPVNYLLEFCIIFNKQVSNDIKHKLCIGLCSDNIKQLKYCLNNIQLEQDDENEIKAKILLAELHD